jgi:4-hydroxymandelate oxidase
MHTDPLAPSVNLVDLEAAARDRIEIAYFDYFAAGANDEITLAENATAYQRIRLAPRVLVDVSRRDLSTTILGRRHSLPILIAPMAFQKLAHADGELATARAASSLDFGMVLSTFSTTAIPDVRAATKAPLWFQLYVYKDREVTRELVERAQDAGCEALVFTVDAPVIGRRERDVRNRLHIPEGLRVANALSTANRAAAAHLSDSGLAQYIMQMIDPALQWRDIEWLRSMTKLPIVVKGIQRADDAARAAEMGVSAMVVSNHGGRQLDTARATIDVLPEVAEAVDGRAEILIDGGVRRGTDVVKALALGARAVLLGRPVIWGLGLGGERGVRRVLELLRDELDLAMALCGCPDTGAVTRDLIARPFPDSD